MKHPRAGILRAQKKLTKSRRALMVDLDAAAAKLGVSRGTLKALSPNKIAIHADPKLGRFVYRDDLEAIKTHILAKLAADPDWLARYGHRARVEREVVSGTSAAPSRVVSYSTSGTTPLRVVSKAPSSRPAKVATIHGAPRPAPPRVVQRGRR